MKELFRKLYIELFGKSVVDTVYASVAGAGGLALAIQFLVGITTDKAAGSAESAQTAPFFWQVYIVVLVMLSHGQRNIAVDDKKTSIYRYYFCRFIEAIAIIVCFVFSGLIAKYNAPMFYLVFFGLAAMLLSIVFRRLITDSGDMFMQLLRLISTFWFVYVGLWYAYSQKEIQTFVKEVSISLFIFYILILIMRFIKSHQD